MLYAANNVRKPALLSLAAAITMLALLLSSLSFAASSPYVTPSISLNPNHGPTGTVVTVTGVGFNPNVGITLSTSTGSLTISGSITTDSSGKFTAQVTVVAASAPKINILAMGSDHASIPKDTATAQFTVDNVQAGHSGNIIVTGGNATRDDTNTDGVKVSVSGIPGIHNVTVTTASLNAPGNGVAIASSTGTTLYFDVKVTLPPGQSPPSGATVNVCFTDPTVTSGQTLQYFDGSNWVSATNVQITGNQICGTVPLSALTGTNFAVVALAGPDYTWVYIVVIVAAIAVIIGVAYAMRRRRV